MRIVLTLPITLYAVLTFVKDKWHIILFTLAAGILLGILINVPVAQTKCETICTYTQDESDKECHTICKRTTYFEDDNKLNH